MNKIANTRSKRRNLRDKVKMTKLFILVFFNIISANLCYCDDVVDYMAEYLKITYTVIDNLEQDIVFTGQFGLTNTGTTEIQPGDWAIHFCLIRQLEPEVLPDPEGTPLGSSGLQAYHVTGCLNKLVPNDQFVGLGPGSTLQVPFSSSDWQVARLDAMPNWYVINEVNVNGAKLIKMTTGEDLEFVTPFTEPRQWKRTDYDEYNPYTPNERHDLYSAVNDLGEDLLSLLPYPVDVTPLGGAEIDLDAAEWTVVAPTNLSPEGQYLADSLDMSVVHPDNSPGNRYIRLSLASPSDLNLPEFCDKQYRQDEGYTLTVQSSTESVDIMAISNVGILHGVQTFLQLVHKDNKSESYSIRDCPRFSYRGFHIDSGRNFHGDIYRLIEAMSMYKMNKLHLHLTEDEGWRLEIPGLEELTTVGATRCHDPSGDSCILPQLGSEPVQGAGSGTGHWSVEEYRDILRFANDRHIEVIPEFDMPGHGHAAIRAMEARHRKYEQTDPDKASEYRLIDPDDESVYLSAQHYSDNAINPCIQSTYNFVRHLAEQIQLIHADIQPLRFFHFGGDEVPEGAWINSTLCQSLIENNPGMNLKEHFVRSVANITHELGLNLAAWEDGLMSNPKGNVPFDRESVVNDDVLVHAWSNVWEIGYGARPYIFANEGYSTVISGATHLYFDHPSEPDPEERGYYWATRFTDTHKTHGFMPDRMYDNMHVDRFGRELDRDSICQQFGCPDLLETDNIIGIQGQLWSETCRTKEQLYSMIFPRFLSLAERAWHKAWWEDIEDGTLRKQEHLKDWQNFSNRLGYHELPKLEKMDIAYHIRPPGLKLYELNLDARAEFVGMPIKISTNGGASWQDYHANMSVPAHIELRAYTTSVDGFRKSRTISLMVSSGTENTSQAIVTIILLALQYFI